MDIGRSINPAIDYGQIEGAFVQGQGLFTMEESLWTKTGSCSPKVLEHTKYQVKSHRELCSVTLLIISGFSEHSPSIQHIDLAARLGRQADKLGQATLLFRAVKAQESLLSSWDPRFSSL